MIGKNVLPLDGLKQAGREDLPVGSWGSTLNVSDCNGRKILITLNVKDVTNDGG